MRVLSFEKRMDTGKRRLVPGLPVPRPEEISAPLPILNSKTNYLKLIILYASFQSRSESPKILCLNLITSIEIL